MYNIEGEIALKHLECPAAGAKDGRVAGWEIALDEGVGKHRLRGQEVDTGGGG